MSNCYLPSLVRGGWNACLLASRQLASASAVAVTDTLSNTQTPSALLPAAYSQAAAKRHVTSAAAGGPGTPPARCARASVLDGRAVAAAWERELVGEVAHLTDILGRPPGLGVVLVGSRPDSMLYVSKKQEACQKAGMNTFVHHLPDSVTQGQLEAALQHVCADVRVDGVLIQLPLPRHLSEEAVMEVLDPRKDVDGFHPLNMGRMLMRGRGVRLVPATPLGCIELLTRSGVDIQGKNCVVLGDSNIVGTPLAAMLRDKGAAAVTICHRRSYKEWFEDQELVQRKRAAAAVCLPRLPGPTPHGPPLQELEAGLLGDASFQSYQLPDLTRSADILVVAVGHPELVRGDWVRPGAVVIDVGINVVSTLPRHGARPAAPMGQGGQGAGQAGGTQGQASAGDSVSPGCVAGCQGGEGQGEEAGAGAGAEGTEGGGFGQGRSGSPLSSTGGGSGNGGIWYDSSTASVQRNVIFQVVGDVAFEEVSQVAGAITPVPGGVGPMTIAAVLSNTVKAAKYSAGLEPW